MRKITNQRQPKIQPVLHLWKHLSHRAGLESSSTKSAFTTDYPRNCPVAVLGNRRKLVKKTNGRSAPAEMTFNNFSGRHVKHWPCWRFHDLTCNTETPRCVLRSKNGVQNCVHNFALVVCTKHFDIKRSTVRICKNAVHWCRWIPNNHVNGCPPFTNFGPAEHELDWCLTQTTLPRKCCSRLPTSSRSLSWFRVRPTPLWQMYLQRRLRSCRPMEFQWKSTQTCKAKYLTRTSW